MKRHAIFLSLLGLISIGAVRAEESAVVERVRWQPETKIEQALLTIGPVLASGSRPHGEIAAADGRRLSLDYVAVQIGRGGSIITGLRLAVPDAPPLYLDNDEPGRLVAELRKAERLGDGPTGFDTDAVWVRSVGDIVFELPGRGRGEPLALIRWPDRGGRSSLSPLVLNREGYERLISLFTLADGELRRMTR